MQFGDRILYNNGSSTTLGIFLKEINAHESLVKLDSNSIKLVLPSQDLCFLKGTDNMDLSQALVIADYIAKNEYDGHYTLLAFSTGYRFCFGTLEKINYNTTSLMPFGKTVEQAIKIAINNNITADVILDKYDKMFK